MTTRWLCVLALLSLLALSGCGGGGSSTPPIAGNYFPFPAVNTVWTYTTSLEAEIAGGADFTTSTTFTRTYEGTANILVDGVLTLTYMFRHDCTPAPLPPGFVASSPTFGPVLQHLFSNPGGLQSVRAYYRSVAATADMPAHLELVALQRIPDPITDITINRPYLFNPPYDGAAQTANAWFEPQPLMPFITELNGFQLNDKLLEYTDIGGIGGTVNAVVSIYNFASTMPAYGVGCNGRARVFYKNGVGVFGIVGAEMTEFSATLDVGAEQAQVIAQSWLTSML